MEQRKGIRNEHLILLFYVCGYPKITTKKYSTFIKKTNSPFCGILYNSRFYGTIIYVMRFNIVFIHKKFFKMKVLLITAAALSFCLFFLVPGFRRKFQKSFEIDLENVFK